MTQLAVTVVLLLHDDPPNIEKTLRSVEAQVRPGLSVSVLVVDDGTSPRARHLVSQWTTVDTIDVPAGTSIAQAKNLALHAVATDLVLLLDDHMWLLDASDLAAACREISNDESIAGICGYYRTPHRSDWNVLRDIKRHSIYGKGGSRREISRKEFTPFSTGIALVAKSRGWTPDFPEDVFPRGFGGEDIPALMTGIEAGLRFVYTPALAAHHLHELSFADLARKLEVEVRGRFSILYWMTSPAGIRVPYVHGFMNGPVILYISVALAAVGRSGQRRRRWAVVGALSAVEAGLSLQCLNADGRYDYAKRLQASLYVLLSDLLTPVVALQYAVSSWRRPYSRIGLLQFLSMWKHMMHWDLEKYSSLLGRLTRSGGRTHG